MKQYHITFEVPDDFNPDEMEMNVAYKEDVSIVQEGFESLEDMIKSKIKIAEYPSTGSGVFIFKFPKTWAEDENNMETVNAIKDTIENLTGRPTIGLVDDIEILSQNSAGAIDMLKKMIDKINLRSSIKLV